MIKQQTLCVVRDEVLSALHIEARTRGQLDFDASMITNYGRRVRQKDDETGQLIDNDPVRGSASRSYKTSSCPLPPNAFHLTRITRAINMLPEHQKSLALFAYTERCEWHHVETVARELWDAFLRKQDKAFRAKKEKTLKGMVYLAMQNWQHMLKTEADLHTPKRIRELLEINEHHWRRDWLPYWRQLHDLLTEFDEKVLSNVYRATCRKAAADKRKTAAA